MTDWTGKQEMMTDTKKNLQSLKGFDIVSGDWLDLAGLWSGPARFTAMTMAKYDDGRTERGN